MAVTGLTGTLAFAILSAAFGSSFLFGYNIGVINAPQTVVAQWIRNVKCDRAGENPDNETYALWCRKESVDKMFENNASLNFIWSVIASIFCLGGLIGALSTSFFVSRFGRKGTLLLNNVTGIIGAALIAFPKAAHAYEMLIAGRFIMGLNAGLNAGVPPMYFTEISPSGLRGAIGSLHQLFITIAIWVSQILGLPYILGNDFGWPYLFGISVVPCVVQLISLPFCPESPKYIYLGKDDEKEAQKALIRLRNSTDVSEEMDEMRKERSQMKNEPSVTVRDLFTSPLLRKVTIISCMLMVMQQLSGINAVMFYSTKIFQNAGLSGDSALYATIGMGGINVLMTFVSVILVEKAGRKTLLLIGFSGMMVVTVLLTVFMLVFNSGKVEGAANPYEWAAYMSVACVLLFVVFFATGPGSIPWFLVSELFTQGPRAVATGIAVGVNWLCNLIVALCFPLVDAVAKEYTFIIFSVLLLLFVVYTYFKVPETKGKTLEEIQAELRQTL